MPQRMRGPSVFTPDSDLADGMLNFDAASTRIDAFARWADGGADGPVHRYLVNPVRTGMADYRQAQKTHLDPLMTELQSRIGAYRQSGVIEADELGHTFRHRGEVFAALLNSGSDGNLTTMLQSRGWQPAAWSGFLTRMQQTGVLTRDDFDLAQKIWRTFDRLSTAARQVHNTLYGHDPAKTRPTRIHTADGTVTGGAMPAIRTPVTAPPCSRMRRMWMARLAGRWT